MFSRMPTEPMPTGDEQRHFAAATQHLANPAARLTVEEVEIMDEERCGVPVNHGSSAAGIAAMDRRLAVLATSKAKVLDQLENPAWSAEIRTALNEDLAELNRQITTARQRKESYEHQSRQAN